VLVANRGEIACRVPRAAGELGYRTGGAIAGLDAAKAVTSNLNTSFLRRPPAVDLLAHGRLLKLGRRLAVGDVSLISDGNKDPVAHARVTCAFS